MFFDGGYIEEYIPHCFIFDALFFHHIDLDAQYTSDTVVQKYLNSVEEGFVKSPYLTSPQDQFGGDDKEDEVFADFVNSGTQT